MVVGDIAGWDIGRRWKHKPTKSNYSNHIADRVNHRPIITKALSNVTLVVGGNVTMECMVLSDLTKHVEWVKGLCEVNCDNITLVKVMV